MIAGMDSDGHLMLAGDDPRAIQLALAIHGGDMATLTRLIGENPGLENARVGDAKGWRSPLHMAADWPGYFPNGPQAVRILVAAGADPSARDPVGCDESPLHWAASSDDEEVAAALIDAGADITLPGGSIGTPLANAIGYGCWAVARLLVARGAPAQSLWEAAALGDRTRLDELLGGDPAPGQEDIDHAFYQGCRGGHVRIVQALVARGANLEYTPEYSGQTGINVIADAGTTRHQALIEWLRAQGAREDQPTLA
jgi:ankyrin repeat protein